MKRTLAIATLALGLVAFGCDDDDDNGGGTGGTGGATGGAGGRGGTGGTGGATGGTGGATGGTGGATGGTGGATGGTGGATGGTGGTTGGTGGDAGVDTSPDTTGDTGDAGGDTASAMWTAPCSTTPTPATAAEFCMQYMTACGFGAVMGRTAAQSFANMGACVTRYGVYANPGTATTGKMCATYHLCQASQTGNMTVHCPHPAQAGGPCSLPRSEPQPRLKNALALTGDGLLCHKPAWCAFSLSTNWASSSCWWT